jgi:catechol 2,3-dioxygenase
MKLKRIGHVALFVSDEERSRSFYRDVLGFAISEQDPDHGGTFMTLGENFHTIDLFPASGAANERKPGDGKVGLWHMAFEVGRYEDLKRAYAALIEHGVAILQCIDHVSQRSIYFADPDGNELEIYFEVPDAVRRYAVERRGDHDVHLQVTRRGEPLPSWLDEDWLARFEPVSTGAPDRASYGEGGA